MHAYTHTHTGDISEDSVACGIGEILGNKGAVALSFRVLDSSLCFISCHLAARAEKIQQRQANYRKIVNSLHMDKQFSGPFFKQGGKGGDHSVDVLHQFDHLVFAGT